MRERQERRRERDKNQSRQDARREPTSRKTGRKEQAGRESSRRRESKHGRDGQGKREGRGEEREKREPEKEYETESEKYYRKVESGEDFVFVRQRGLSRRKQGDGKRVGEERKNHTRGKADSRADRYSKNRHKEIEHELRDAKSYRKKYFFEYDSRKQNGSENELPQPRDQNGESRDYYRIGIVDSENNPARDSERKDSRGKGQDSGNEGEPKRPNSKNDSPNRFQGSSEDRGGSGKSQSEGNQGPREPRQNPDENRDDDRRASQKRRKIEKRDSTGKRAEDDDGIAKSSQADDRLGSEEAGNRNVQVKLDVSTGVILFFEDNRELRDLDIGSMKAAREDLNGLRKRGQTIAASQRVWNYIDKDSKIEYDEQGRPRMKRGYEVYWANLMEQSLLKKDKHGQFYMSPKYWALLEREQDAMRRDDAEELIKPDEAKPQDEMSRRTKGRGRSVKRHQSIYYQDFRNMEQNWEFRQQPRRQSSRKSLYFNDWKLLENDYMLVEHDTGRKIANSVYAGDWELMERHKMVVVDKKSGELMRPSVYFQHQKSLIDRSRAQSRVEPQSPGGNQVGDASERPNEADKEEQDKPGAGSQDKRETKVKFGGVSVLDWRRLESESIRLYDGKNEKYLDVSVYEGDFRKMERDGLLVHDRKSGVYYRPSEYFGDFMRMEQSRRNEGLYDPKTKSYIETSVYMGDWRKMEEDGLVVKNKISGKEVRPSVYYRDWRVLEGDGPKRKDTQRDRLRTLYQGELERMEKDRLPKSKPEEERSRLRTLYLGEMERMEREGMSEDKLKQERNRLKTLYLGEMERMERDSQARKKQDDERNRLRSLYLGEMERMEREGMSEDRRKQERSRLRSLYLGEMERMERDSRAQNMGHSDRNRQMSLHPGEMERMEREGQTPANRNRDKSRQKSIYAKDFHMMENTSQKDTQREREWRGRLLSVYGEDFHNLEGITDPERHRKKSKSGLDRSLYEAEMRRLEFEAKKKYSRVSLEPGELALLMRGDAETGRGMRASSKLRSVYMDDWRVMEGHPEKKAKSEVDKSIYQADWMAMERQPKVPKFPDTRNKSVVLYGYDFKHFLEKNERQRQSGISMSPSMLDFTNRDSNPFLSKTKHSRLSLRPSHLHFMNEDSEYYRTRKSRLEAQRISKRGNGNQQLEQSEYPDKGPMHTNEPSQRRESAENQFDTKGNGLSHLISKHPEQETQRRDSKNIFNNDSNIDSGAEAEDAPERGDQHGTHFTGQRGKLSFRDSKAVSKGESEGDIKPLYPPRKDTFGAGEDAGRRGRT